MFNEQKTFTVTEEHLKLLKRMYFSWYNCEYGAPAVDPKRPYGNSDVVGDIAEILEWGEPDDDYYDRFDDKAWFIHQEMQTVLQILTYNLSIEPGEYVSTRYGVNWEKI